MTYRFREASNGAGVVTALEDWLADAIAGFDAFQELVPDAPKHGCYGSSFGGYLASRLTALRKVDALVLRSPAAYPARFLSLHPREVDNHREAIWDYRRDEAVRKDIAIQALGRYSGDVLIVGAEFDEEVPAPTTLAYFEAANHGGGCELKWIPGANHSMNTPEHDGMFISLMCDWFTESFAHGSTAAGSGARMPHARPGLHDTRG